LRSWVGEIGFQHRGAGRVAPDRLARKGKARGRGTRGSRPSRGSSATRRAASRAQPECRIRFRVRAASALACASPSGSRHSGRQPASSAWRIPRAADRTVTGRRQERRRIFAASRMAGTVVPAVRLGGVDYPRPAAFSARRRPRRITPARPTPGPVADTQPRTPRSAAKRDAAVGRVAAGAQSPARWR
jgi:hypothetical protein